MSTLLSSDAMELFLFTNLKSAHVQIAASFIGDEADYQRFCKCSREGD
jgi:hypothetical protein